MAAIGKNCSKASLGMSVTQIMQLLTWQGISICCTYYLQVTNASFRMNWSLICFFSNAVEFTLMAEKKITFFL